MFIFISLSQRFPCSRRQNEPCDKAVRSLSTGTTHPQEFATCECRNGNCPSGYSTDGPQTLSYRGMYDAIYTPRASVRMATVVRVGIPQTVPKHSLTEVCMILYIHHVQVSEWRQLSEWVFHRRSPHTLLQRYVWWYIYTTCECPNGNSCPSGYSTDGPHTLSYRGMYDAIYTPRASVRMATVVRVDIPQTVPTHSLTEVGMMVRTTSPGSRVENGSCSINSTYSS